MFRKVNQTELQVQERMRELLERYNLKKLIGRISGFLTTETPILSSLAKTILSDEKLSKELDSAMHELNQGNVARITVKNKTYRLVRAGY